MVLGGRSRRIGGERWSVETNVSLTSNADVTNVDVFALALDKKNIGF
jgi:hypothetical protein